MAEQENGNASSSAPPTGELLPVVQPISDVATPAAAQTKRDRTLEIIRLKAELEEMTKNFNNLQALNQRVMFEMKKINDTPAIHCPVCPCGKTKHLEQKHFGPMPQEDPKKEFRSYSVQWYCPEHNEMVAAKPLGAPPSPAPTVGIDPNTPVAVPKSPTVQELHTIHAIKLKQEADKKAAAEAKKQSTKRAAEDTEVKQ